jgi:hypothetical protein
MLRRLQNQGDCQSTRLFSAHVDPCLKLNVVFQRLASLVPRSELCFVSQAKVNLASRCQRMDEHIQLVWRCVTLLETISELESKKQVAARVSKEHTTEGSRRS